MKRFWLILLSLGLVMAFSVPAWALDVQFSGSYYAAGVYVNKTLVRDSYFGNPSTAFYFQRLRVETDFVVSPGLKLITRFDALERTWGATRSSPSSSRAVDSAETEAENENIAFDWAYIQYASPVGIFAVGYQNDGAWGTVFGDSSVPQGKIGWSMQYGGLTFMADIVKLYDGSKTAKNSTNLTDRDFDKYQAGVIYSWMKGSEVGFAGAYFRYAAEKNSANFFSFPTLASGFVLMPYAKVQIGPVKIQAELNYGFGDAKMENGVVGQDVKLESIGFFLDAVADFNMFYAGGTFAYVSGDDPATTGKLEGGFPGIIGGLNGGIDWNPCLIMFNYDVITKWVGQLQGWSGSRVGGPMTNAWFGQGRVGVRPIAPLDIMASVSYAIADKRPDPWNTGSTYVDNKYGTEVDLIATYKITNNLSYMLGVGYLFTGDYYKGYQFYSNILKILDDYMVINKLTLTF